MVYFMFGKEIHDFSSYRLFGVHKNGMLYCATYYYDDNGIETITSINTGEVFYNLIDYTRSIYGIATDYEWTECSYLTDDGDWSPLYLLCV